MEPHSSLLNPKAKVAVWQIIIVVVSSFIILTVLWHFNLNLLYSFSLPIQMILLIVTQWMFLLIPAILMLINKEKPSSIGLITDNLVQQIMVGLGIAVLMSLGLTVLPILLGFKDLVSSVRYTEIWQIAFHFIRSIFGVALAEEILFRGYIFYKLQDIKDNKPFSIIVSSILFGLFHIFNGSIIQLFVTAAIGILFCVLREKIKGCTLISLIAAHGVYNGLIVLWVAIL